MKSYYLYILASEKNGTLYIGVTSNLIKRIQEHKTKIIDGFTKEYGISKLVHYEQTENIHSAIAREKALKKWNRAWKIKLIEQNNPNWDDLYFKIIA
ncbi:MAG: GIY-YIG nuclease family protein [Candidatus Moranbacteria bacterium]|nr:GIY-YIG nuclease family protein [Candidatus Moranbacteria bacterium]